MCRTELTVILPVYNGMPYLTAAVNSILSQSFSNFNLLIINNGSTDDTEKYIYSLNDERIKYFYLKEKNFVKALNLGLSNSDSPFIARMDADDTCHPSRFEKQINFLKTNNDVGLVGTLGQYYGNKKNRIINLHLPVTHQDIVNSMLNSRHAIIHASVIFRKSIFDEMEYYDEKYFSCEDFELFLRLSRKTKLANIPQHLYNFRIRKDSVVSENIKKSIATYYKISEQYLNRNNERLFNLFFQKLDLQAIYFYRKALNHYLNNSTAAGVFYFILSALLSPSRLISRIKKIISS